MGSFVPPAPRHPRHLALRELLVSVLRWEHVQAAPLRLAIGGREFQLRPLARSQQAVAVMCEPPVSDPLPDYETRRQLRPQLDTLFGRHLSIFTDPAHTTEVWAWTSRHPGGPLAYHEYGAPPYQPDAELLRTLSTASLDLNDTALPATTVDADGPEASVLRTLLARVRPRDGPEQHADELAQRVQDLIEETTRPEALRGIWHALLDTTVLDPACGAGSWLLRVLDALEPVYAACLERMRGLTDELSRFRAAHRRDRLRDFRTILQHVEPFPLHGPPPERRSVCELIVLHNLHGAEASASALDTCRLRLQLRLSAGGAGAGSGEHPALGWALRRGRPEAGFASQEAFASAVPRDHAHRVLEEAEAIDRAARMLFRMYLFQGLSPEETRHGVKLLHERRDRVGMALHRSLAAVRGIAPQQSGRFRAWLEREQPLHVFSEFYGVAKRGGFRLVRGRVE